MAKWPGSNPTSAVTGGVPVSSTSSSCGEIDDIPSPAVSSALSTTAGNLKKNRNKEFHMG